MDELEKVWGNNNMEDLPFSTTVNEYKILEIIEKLYSENKITINIYKKVKQWIKFNHSFNEVLHESELEYRDNVHNVYCKIEDLFGKCGFEPLIEKNNYTKIQK
jgi:hypothetical protein